MNNLVNFKSFFKFLSRNKTYTAIDIFGLSVSLMFVILIAVYSVQELSTDKYHEKGDRIYVLSSEANTGSAYKLAYRLQERYPEIEKVCPVAPWGFYHTSVTVTDKNFNAELMFADTTFFDFFSFPLLVGDRNHVMDADDYGVISESFARKVFSDSDPIGQVVQVNDSIRIQVNGIMKDIQNSTIPYCDILMGIKQLKYMEEEMDSDQFYNTGAVNNFIMVKEGADLLAKTDDIVAYFKEVFWMYQRGIYSKVLLNPLEDFYFSDMGTYTLAKGDWQFVMILLSVGILILLFAIINYINLTVAQTAFRAKEMATRRLLGSSRGDLFLRLIMESTLMTFISFLLGIFLAIFFSPYASQLLNARINLSDFVTPGYVLLAVAVILLIGILAGLLPAIVISNAKPIEVVRGTFRRQTKMVFSKFFITFQNGITIALVAASITMVAQVNHLIHAPLGYKTTNVMDVPVESYKSKTDIETFANEVSQLASVKRIAFSQGTPFNRGNNSTEEINGKQVSFQVFRADTAFLSILGIEIIRDNHLAGPKKVYLNQQAMREMELPEDSPSIKVWGQEIPIAGIVKDFQLSNIMYQKKPVRLLIKNDIKEWIPYNVLLEVEGDPVESYKDIQEIYERIGHVGFEGKYIDTQIQESFAAQERTSRIVSIFAFVAILISLLGLLAMSTYFIQQRSSEVAVRKVFGSTNSQILYRLIRTFLVYVLIAFVIATPIIWRFMQQWLSDYSYRIELSPLIFIAAGLFCLFVSFVTIFIQSYQAANLNPVESIKNK
ncbi:ABC transporter permease [Parabacteroides faecis]|uniref:ABC transporter permease n=1 Tax=Parabacteroides faecis TaxID=1217282 RepID=UPI003521C79F